MAKISLSNPKLRSFVRKKLGLPKFGNGFDDIVEEMFLREKYVLNLSPQEFLEDLNNFAESIESIEWANLEEGDLGCYYPNEKKIRISIEYYQDLCNTYSKEEVYEKIIETIFHECLHGAQTDKDGWNRAEGFNDEINNRTHALYEIATEATATKMCKNRTIKDFMKNDLLEGDGYSQEIFAIPLLAATFGVKEQDVMKYCMREKEKLIELLDTNIGNKEITENLVDRIELQLEHMHSAFYPDEDQYEYEELDEQKKLRVTGAAINNLLDICQEAMADRIKNIPFSYDKNIIDNLVYDYIKINNTIEHEWQHYGTYFFAEDQADSFDQMQMNRPYTNYIEKSITYLSALNQPKNRYLQPYATDIISAIKFENYQYLSGINLSPEDYILKYSESVADQHRHDDYNDFRIWDNQKIYYALMNGQNFVQTAHKDKFNASDWSDINTSEGLRKLSALKGFYPNKRKNSLKMKIALFDILDQTDIQPVARAYVSRTGRSMSNNANSAQGHISPREAMLKYFNKPDDKVYIAALIADRFVKKAFDEHGNMKRLEDSEETQMQQLLHPTIRRFMNERHLTAEQSLNQVRFALKNILLNDNYQGVSSETSRQMLSIYGKTSIFDIISQPLVDELISERRIIPEKKEAFDYIASKTIEEYPQDGSDRIIAALDYFRRGADQESISQIFPAFTRQPFNYYFRNQRDYADMLGIMCNEYSRQNYQIETKQNSIADSSIQQILNTLGPDEFREVIINGFLKNDYTRVPDKTMRQLLSHNIDFCIKKITDTYVRDIKQAHNYERWADNAYTEGEKFSKNNGIYETIGYAVPKVSLIDISKIVYEEVDNRGIYARFTRFLDKFRQIITGRENDKSQDKDKDKDEEVK